ncbi:MAG: M23 family metallopeptidase [Alphaproteobacteria bacterium]|nr:MAG: M23 family metallopeptidase [Alphaproteobacteria bacterium]
MARALSVLGVVGTVVAVVLLAGCSSGSGPSDYRYIKPVWVVRNAPVPVPHPVRRPSAPPKREASSPVASDVASAGGSAGSHRVTVRKGDTLYAISRRTGVHVRSIIAHNNLRPPYLLKPGQRLVIPAAPVHVVRKGETSYAISRAYDVDLAVLMRLNGIRPPYTLYPGQKLKLPPSAARSAGSARRASLPAPPRRAGSGLAWPVKGRIVSSFGPKKGGLHNDGINIAAPRGTAIRASEAGVVAYAGNGLKGYGNLILLQHDGGWVTAYAHTDRMLVKRGQKVNRGQTIAYVGCTGGVDRPQLHFEIRKGRKAVNPLGYLTR